jgi:uncharacterized protein
MGAAALAFPTGLSLVTIGERSLPAWAAVPPAHRHIACSARTRTERNLLAAKLDEAVTQADRAVLLLAQGAGCFATAWWARLSPASYVARVAGALFFEPEGEGRASAQALLDTFASPRIALPFPSILVNSADGRALPPQFSAIAEGWGSRVAVEAESDNPLARTRRAILRFAAAVVEHDVYTAARLAGRA